MSNSRFHEGREHRFTMSKPTEKDPVLIVCPKCSCKAAVVPMGEDKVKASCFECGFTTEKSSNGRSFSWSDDNPTDGYFGFDLWLRTDCIGYSLWAFNSKHLEFLESYVSAKLRERTKDETWGWSNSSLASRLPKWIKSAKNRDALLKAISELKEMAGITPAALPGGQILKIWTNIRGRDVGCRGERYGPIVGGSQMIMETVYRLIKMRFGNLLSKRLAPGRATEGTPYHFFEMTSNTRDAYAEQSS